MYERFRVPWAWTAILVVFVVTQTACVSNLAYATKMHYIHWNTSNPIFRIDNTDHIIDVNKGNVPFEYDQVNIICPVYSESTREDDAEKYIIYNVSKEEYDTCRITNPSPRIIAVCDKPYKLMYFTITFRSFTPQPGGLEFKPGQDYYFISTSSNDDLHRRIGGRCTTHNMKVVFKVCCDPASQPPRDQANGHLQSNGISISLDGSSSTSSTTKFSSVSTTPKSSPTTTTSTTTTTRESTTSLKTTSHKSTGTRTKSNGPKAAGTKKETHTSKKNVAVKKEWSGGSSAFSFVSCQAFWFGLPFRVWFTSLFSIISFYSYYSSAL